MRDPNYSPIGAKAVPVTASVLTSASAVAAGLGPFSFVYVNATASLAITFYDGTTCTFDAVQPNSYLWTQGEFIHSIASTSGTLFVMKD